tara:strand:- start:820 stop:2160 length:1341 start_codon:yes stop_codon:yes gene_type:complete
MKAIKNKINFKLYISQFLFFLYFIKGQSYNDLYIDLDQAFFNLNELNFETNISADSINNGKLKINSFQFGFDKINFDNIKDKSIKMKVHGPKLFIDFMEFRSNYILPDYYNLLLSDLSDKRYEYPYDGLEILQKAIETYFLKFDGYPNDYNDLVTQVMIRSSKYPFKNKNWSYHLFLPDSIVVKTTSQYKLPKKSVNFDWETRTIINKQSDIYSKDEINWSLDLKISNIKQTFISDIDINLSSDKLSLEIYQKTGTFNLENMSVALVPNNDLFEQTLFKMNNVFIEINDLFLQYSNENTTPTIQNGNGDFLIRNIDLKLPPTLIKDETMKHVMQDLGVRNGLVRVRRIDLKFRFYDNQFGAISASINSAFLNIGLEGQFSIDAKKKDLRYLDLFDTELRVNPISYGVRDIIREWEIRNNKNLNREGSVIVLKLTGPLKKPLIQGIN